MVTTAERPVVVAYDGSGAADAAVDYVPQLLQRRAVDVVSVWESTAAAAPASLLAIPAGMAHDAYEKLDAQVKAQAEALAADAAERLGAHGVNGSPHALPCHGNVWSTILDYADEHDAGLVVVGSRGRSPVSSALLGSVSNGIVHHSSRPVLVVHDDATRRRGEAAASSPA